MLCETCKNQPATVECIDVENRRVKRESHLCEGCAVEQGLPVKPTAISVSELLASLIDQNLARPTEDPPKIVCSSCGMSFQQFRTKGRLGCPQDYEHFRKGLEALLDRIHGAKRHAGKVPRRAGQLASVERDLTEHRNRLAKAVQKEDYEQAAEIRDRIVELERRVQDRKDRV
jgi:protein arginine kinase activator